MNDIEIRKLNKEKKFQRKKRKGNYVYNPIREIEYGSGVTSFLRHPDVTSNVIGADNDIISGLFCYDTPEKTHTYTKKNRRKF